MRLAFHPFIKDSVIYGGSRVVHAAVFFLAVAVLTKHLSPSDYGHAALFQAVVLLFLPFMDVGTLIQRAWHIYPEEELFHYMRASMAACLVRAAQLAVLLAMLGWWVSRETGLDCKWLFMALGVAMLQAVLTLCHAFWQASRSVWLRNVTWIWFSLLYLLLAWGFVSVWPLGWLAPVFALFISMLVIMTVSLSLFWRRLALFRKATSRSSIKEIMTAQRPLLLHQVSAPLYLYATQLILAHYLPFHEVGILALSIQCATIINLYGDSIMPALAPWIQAYLKAPSPLQLTHLVKMTGGFIALLFLITLATAFMAPWLIPLMANASYDGAATFIPWICVAFFCQGIVRLLTPYVLFYPEWYSAVSSATVKSIVVYFGLIIILVQTNGIRGAITAMVLGFMFRTLLWVRLAWRAHTRNKSSKAH